MGRCRAERWLTPDYRHVSQQNAPAKSVADERVVDA